MDKTSANNVIRKSLEAGSGTPCTWREDRDAYIDEKSKELLEAVIDPIKVEIKRTCNDTGILEDFADSEYFVIANVDQHWLVYLTEKKSFALAFGENPESLAFLGYHSDDALAEWLG